MKYAALLLLAVCAVANAADAPLPKGSIPLLDKDSLSPANCLPWPPGSSVTPTQCIAASPWVIPNDSEAFYDEDCAKFHIKKGDPSPGYTVEHVAVACPPAVDRSWHLMSVTYGGTVTLLKGLTHHEAEFMYDRLMGLPATAKEKSKAAADQAASDKEYTDELIAAKAACAHGEKSKEWLVHEAGQNASIFSSWTFDCYRKEIMGGEEIMGGGGTSGTLISIGPGDIKSAEIFQ